MKTLFLSILAAGMLFSGCHSNNNSTTASTTGVGTDGPVMKFEKETHDFGKIKPGDTVTYDFKFTNAGKSPLIITSGYASCGCTTPTWPKAPVKPGEGGIIHVKFDSKGKMGLQDKLITITANTNPADNHVHLIGEVAVN
jgi:hypothetical protein